MTAERWEYKVVPAPSSFWGINKPEKMAEALNREGQQGWELVNVVAQGIVLHLFLKRAR
jgi:hypothetical protein